MGIIRLERYQFVLLYAHHMMEEGYKPMAQPQRHLNPTMKEVVRKEVVKLLED
ncbi:hypothetical protein A2U01_0112304, partial [Trifolium medium]|nr:hypothetical protein [Trifolium medium]